MIDATDVVTFHSDNAPRSELTWLAQVMLPNGKFWGVYFTGSSEAEVVGKAIALWNAEEENRSEVTDSNGIVHSAPSGRGSHLLSMSLRGISGVELEASDYTVENRKASNKS